MSKIHDPNRGKPFVNTAALSILVKEEKGKITAFEVRTLNKLHVVTVKKDNVLEAFKKVEKLTKHL